MMLLLLLLLVGGHGCQGMWMRMVWMLMLGISWIHRLDATTAAIGRRRWRRSTRRMGNCSWLAGGRH